MNFSPKTSVLFFLALLFSSGCEAPHPPKYLYPTVHMIEVSHLCRLPYHDVSAPHQLWATSPPVWLMATETEVAVYFDNDRAFVLERTPDITLPPGKYRCPR